MNYSGEIKQKSSVWCSKANKLELLNAPEGC